MVRTIITPLEANILLEIPQNYIGKQIEVFLYSVDEITDEIKIEKNKNASQFKGIFSKEEGEKFNSYIEKARTEWDRNI